ncbi:MAG: hypothetical protein HYR52_02910, partial [Candidatus Tectomicrobia bacterium]|nr:hypothetical protein [Candidatus Tectomicrobia bacterium]
EAGRGEAAAWAYLHAVRRDPYFEVSEAATLAGLLSGMVGGVEVGGQVG